MKHYESMEILSNFQNVKSPIEHFLATVLV